MHTIVLPYFCETEVSRFKRILRLMASFGPQTASFEFLLAASWQTEPDDSLLEVAKAVAPARHFHCPTTIKGYPDGANAMFWDCMREVAGNPGDGFALWFESDMCPIKADWLSRLDAQWRWTQATTDQQTLCMGLLIPRNEIRVRRSRKWYMVNKYLRPMKAITLDPHINGGACYSRDFAFRVGANYRGEAFDVELGPHLANLGGFASTTAFTFAGIDDLNAEAAHPDRLIVHGFNQDKEQFIDAAVVAAGGPAPLRMYSPKKNRETKPTSRRQMLIADIVEHVRTDIERQTSCVRLFGPHFEVRDQADWQTILREHGERSPLRRHAA